MNRAVAARPLPFLLREADMPIYERGSRFQVKITTPEGRLTGTFLTRALAEAWENHVSEHRRLGKPWMTAEDFLDTERAGNPGTMSIQKVFDLTDRRHWTGNPECKSGDKGQYQNAKVYVAWCGPDMPAKEALDEETIHGFIEFRLSEKNNSGSTLNRYMSAIRMMAREAKRKKVLEEVPELPSWPEGQCRLRWFTPEEVAAILETCRQWAYLDHADLFTFLVDTGVRPGEAHKLTWEDLRKSAQEDGTEIRRVHLEKGITKNSTERILTLTPRAYAAWLRMWETRGHLGDACGPFYWAAPKSTTTRHLWKRLRGHLEFLGSDAVVYTFRHTCASWMVQRGARLDHLQVWMGHKSITMTQRYAKFAPTHLADDLSKLLT